MRKNKLIALLQSIPDNPDILLWNGMVGDWMDINPNIVEQELYKRNPETQRDMIEFQSKQDGGGRKVSPEEFEEIKKRCRKGDWELPNEFADEKMIKMMYGKKKKVYIIDAKPRGKSTHDRLGKIGY